MNINNKLSLCIVFLMIPFLMGKVGLGNESENTLKKQIKNSAPSEEAFLAVQKLAKPHIIECDWWTASYIFEDHKYLFPKMSRRFENIIAMLTRGDEGWIVEVMNDHINTMQFNDFSPVPSADGKYLYFASDRTETGYGKEDVFISEISGGVWLPAKNISGNINTAASEAPSSISQDGLQLILFGNYEGSKGRGDLFVSEFIDTVWTPVVPFPVGVNTRYFEGDGVYSPDGRAFFFTSDRPGGIGKYHKRDELFNGSYSGNLDIYVMERTEFGTWSEPENLGEMVNTPFCDQDPFITPDGNTLYFASGGHYGIGGLDIFKSTRIATDSWTRWSEPVNLGKEINTVWDDFGYKWDASGDSAFFTIAINGNTNIYTVKHSSVLLPHIDPVKIYGMITGKDSSRIHAEITVTYADSDSIVQRTFTDSLFGVFHVILDDNNHYELSVNKPGFTKVTKTLNLADYEAGASTALDFALTRLPVVIPDYDIPSILFDFRKYDIHPGQFYILDDLADFIRKYPHSRFEIAGHTDNIGSDGTNLLLSKKRVESVLSYLEQLGISEDHFVVNYFGSLNPVQPNDTEQGRQYNRRVDILQTKSPR